MSDHHFQPGDPRLSEHLARRIRGEVRFDAVTRGLYSTDASIYQVEPLGVVIPRSTEDVEAVMAVARQEGVPVLPRGAGTSQCGQTVGRALVVDTSRHLRRVLELDVEARRVRVEPGLVLDHLNEALRPHGLFFPVDVATANRATLGGMAGNNSAGARSIRYGMMVDNVRGVDALLADGRRVRFGSPDEGDQVPDLTASMAALHAREANEIARRTPRVSRHVAGYNLHRLGVGSLTPLLVGSEGTLAFFASLELALQPLPAHRVLGVVPFPSLRAAMEAVRHVVALGPSAVELVDRTVLERARSRPALRDAVNRFAPIAADAILLVEFAGDDGAAVVDGLDRLASAAGDLRASGPVHRATAAPSQAEIWSVRKTGMNLVMSVAGPRKPVSFVEDCAVPLDRLGEYADRVTEVFRSHGCEGTWYAHASVGCLHVRPALDLKDPADIERMRAIARQVHEVVRDLGGSHSGEHGDGILRSEFLEPMLGSRMVRAFGQVKQAFDPRGLLNPGKIVDAPRFDDRSLFRYGPDYRERPLPVALDWSAQGGLLRAVELCNNNGTCRKRDPGVMCPSYRATGQEQDSTRGRANVLRLALTGQLDFGDDPLAAPEVQDVLDLCIGCKACRRECPTGVDVARMKLEVLDRHHRRHGVGLRTRMTASLPRWGPWVRSLAPLFRLRNRSRTLRRVGEGLTGVDRRRSLPVPAPDPFREARELSGGPEPAPPVALFVDTFARTWEPWIARDAVRVLRGWGWQVRPAGNPSGGRRTRPLCCGRTWLSAGLLDRARQEASRTVDALAPLVRAGVPLVGLEPSCVLTFRDEIPDLVPGTAAREVASAMRLVTELLAERGVSPESSPTLSPVEASRAWLHPHCHEKSFGVDGTLAGALDRIPGLELRTLASGCCGMAGAFGYEREHFELSLAMAELELFPGLRAAAPQDWIVADGTSCRAQIRDGLGRPALHSVEVLARALATSGP